ncbi:cytokine receptor-like isoform X2 [Hermetia illucens]|uniref:cytokine receptor-like isoform X2 n=1 Tax=Hermetia illucens TaxID=343691 RepID=UPI0018CC061F|nr:cytokine receptor-like isoform X2 [Hermetia illucens]
MNNKRYKFIKPIHLAFQIIFISTHIAIDTHSYPCKHMVSVGSTYKLSCSYFNQDNSETAHNLVFRRNGTMLSPLHYQIINENTVEYVWDNIPRVSADIECSFHVQDTDTYKGIFIKSVVAEYPPMKVTSFKCVSHDFQYLICWYEKPEQYCTSTRFLPENCQQVPYGSPNSCRLSQPAYDPVNQNIYQFTVLSKNHLGEISQNFSINHLDNVIPGKPNVSLSTIKPNSVILRLTKHDRLYMEKGLMYEIKVWETSFPSSTITLDTTDIDPFPIQQTFTVANLDAYRSYTIEVKAKSMVTENISEMWSQPTNINFDTPPKPPDYPPKVDAGGFYVDLEGKIHIFWEMLPENRHNGENFRYKISLEGLDENHIRNKIRQVRDTFTTSYDIPTDDYKFTIWSANDNGSSPGASLTISKNAYPAPRKVRNVYHGKFYQLSWKIPRGGGTVQNYTVFSCIRDKRINQANTCSRDFKFVHVSNTTNSMTFTAGDHFAVSANYLNGSSGMIWAECVAPVTSDIGTITYPLLSVVNSTAIHIEWVITCIQKSLVQGYKIKYCTEMEDICATKIVDDELDEAYLTNLTPNTEYKVQISMVSESQSGVYSEMKKCKTLEEAPSPPRNLLVCNVTKDMVSLQWEKPELLNGILRYYKVWYNNKSIELTNEDYLTAELVKFNLENLESFQTYELSVVAGTVANSKPSNKVHVQTAVSDPEVISIISLETLDADQFNIKWTSGPENEFIMKAYEIEIRNYMQNEIKRSLVVGGFNYIVEGMKCTSNSTTYQMSVRPINVIRENQIQGCVVTYKTVLAIENWDNYTNGRNYQNALHLKEEISSFSKDNHTFIRLIYGPWSVPLLYECNKTAATSVTHAIVIPAVLLLIIITAALLYYIRRRYKTAKSIGIVLPPGLSDDESKTSQGGKYDETDYSTDEAEEANFIEARSLIDENMDEGYCTSQRDSLSSSTDEKESFGKNAKISYLFEPKSERDGKIFTLNANGYVLQHPIPEEDETLFSDYRNELYPPNCNSDLFTFTENGYVKNNNLVKGKDEILYLPANDNNFLTGSNPPNKFKPHSTRNYWNKNKMPKFSNDHSNSNVERAVQSFILNDNGYVLPSSIPAAVDFSKNDEKREQISAKHLDPLVFSENGYVKQSAFMPVATQRGTFKMSDGNRKSDPFSATDSIHPKVLDLVFRSRPEKFTTMVQINDENDSQQPELSAERIPHSRVIDSSGYLVNTNAVKAFHPGLKSTDLNSLPNQCTVSTPEIRQPSPSLMPTIPR